VRGWPRTPPSHGELPPFPWILASTYPKRLLIVPLLAVVALVAASPVGSRTLTTNCTAGADWGQARQSLTPALLDLVNAHRATLGLSQLQTSPTLTASALWKARHMARYGYFAHDDPAPPVARSVFQRIRDCGYNGAAVGENIAEGYRTAASVMQAWLLSPGHRANIEGASWKAIGLGVAQAANGTLFWVQDFGSTVDSGAVASGRPRAHADRLAVRRGRRVSVRVLRNDSDADGDHLIVLGLLKLPAHGRAWVSANHQRVVYRSSGRFVGTDRFRYEVSDGKGGFASAPVVVRVER
jgi:uncharacterized protein YkwD